MSAAWQEGPHGTRYHQPQTAKYQYPMGGLLFDARLKRDQFRSQSQVKAQLPSATPPSTILSRVVGGWWVVGGRLTGKMIQIRKAEKLPRKAITFPKPGKTTPVRQHRQVISVLVKTLYILYRGIPSCGVVCTLLTIRELLGEG